MIFVRRRKRALISLSLAVLTISCRSQNNSVVNENSSTDTHVSSTPPFQTKEPDRYRAIRTVTIVLDNAVQANFELLTLRVRRTSALVRR
jgi:hypothetical protein